MGVEMKEFLNDFVPEDTAEAWEEFKSEMPWDPSNRALGSFSELNFERIEMANQSPEAIERVLAESAPGTIWAEFYVHPGISLANDFYPIVLNCLQLSCLDRVPSMNSLVGLYQSDKALPGENQISPTSFLAVACPRCHLIFVDGDVEEEFEPDDEESWVESDCPACEGIGEWVYELPLGSKD
jgi:hypothetical protein